MSQKNPKSPKGPASLEIVGKSGNTVAKLDDIDLEQLTAISVPIKKRINALKNEQVKLLDLEKQFFEELHQLECKYAKLQEPIFEKRRKIVIGELEPTDEEAKWTLDDHEEADEAKEKTTNGESEENKSDEKPKIDESKLTESGKKLLSDLKAQFDSKKSGVEKGIPNFWLETLQAFRMTAEMIEEHDEPVLAFLQDIRVRMHEQKPYGYTLEFEFAENPYFTNKVLTKTFELKMDVDSKDPFSYDGPDLERCVGCKIDWKPNKNVTVRLTKKKIKGRNKKAPPKIITKEEKQESFFGFFETRPEVAKGSGQKKGRNTASESSDAGGKQVAVKSNSHPDDEDEEEDEDDMDEEDAHDLYLMTEFETGQYIKDKIIPKAVLYFTGELDDMDDGDDYDDGEDYDEEDDDDNDDDDDDEDDDDEDDDDEDEDDHPKGGNKKGGAGGKGGKKGGKPSGKGEAGSGKPGEPTPSECKQN